MYMLYICTVLQSRAAVVDDSKPASSQSTNKQSVEGETSVVDNQSTRQQKQLKTTAQNEVSVQC